MYLTKMGLNKSSFFVRMSDHTSVCSFLRILMPSSFFFSKKHKINPQSFSRLCKRLVNYISVPRTAPSTAHPAPQMYMNSGLRFGVCVLNSEKKRKF